MFNVKEEEENIIISYEQELNNCTNKDSVNKNYRQVRIWNRWHYCFAGACTEDRYHELNSIFKELRKKRIDELI